MEKEVIANTNIKPDYQKYLYVLGPNKVTGTLDVIRIEKKSKKQSKGGK